MAEVGRIRATIELNTTDFTRGMNNARQQMSGMSTSAQNMKRDFGGLQKASAAVGGIIAAAIGSSIKVAADFEQQMSRVKAISGATETEFANLNATAMELGANTSKSASEVAIAMEDMAAMGFNATEIIAAMPGVIAAAEASGSDLALTSQVVAAALNGFGLEAAEASRVADILAMTANVSAASVDDMGYALKYVGPVANTLGISLEEVSATIGIMTNAGLEGSNAGTALRAALLALNSPAEAQSKMMEKLGFSMRDGSGEAKGLSEIIGDLQKATEGMTEAEKVATVAKLVGTEASAGVLAVMAQGPEVIDEMTRSLENSEGAAADAAAVMKDNVLGAYEEFGGALETLGIKIGNEFLPVFREIIETGSELVGWISEFDGESLKLALSFAGITSAIGLALSAVGKLSLAFSAMALTPVGAAIIGISLLGGALGTLAIQQSGAKDVNLEYTQSLIDEQQALDASISKYDALNGKLKLSSDELARFVDINSLLQQTADPEIIARLKDEQALLQEKSGLTNEEFTELLGLNQQLIETVPQSNVVITEQGNVLLETTEAAKALNAEKAELVRLQLEADLAAAESIQAEKLAKQKQLQSELNDEERKSSAILDELAEKETYIGDLKAQLRSAEKEGDQAKAIMIQGLIDSENINLQQLRDKNAKHKENILAKAEELELVNTELGKLDATRQKMVDLELKQVGLNAKKGEGLKVIDSTIAKLQTEKQKLDNNTSAAQRNTGEYREAVEKINNQISALETARQKVVNITGAAGTMNRELGKTINKSVVIKTVGGTARGGTGQSLKQLPGLDYHTGGLVGQNPLNRMPKLHTGGTVAALQERFSQPMQHEIDVRLLKNEMVITESQQANLMRMIDAGHTSAGAMPVLTETHAILRSIERGIHEGKNVSVRLSSDEVYESVDNSMMRDFSTDQMLRGLRSND